MITSRANFIKKSESQSKVIALFDIIYADDLLSWPVEVEFDEATG